MAISINNGTASIWMCTDLLFDSFETPGYEQVE
jgi:hypothetical protein